MATFSVVTEVHSDEQLWINLDRIRWLRRDNESNATEIMFDANEASLAVRESPQKVLANRADGW